jgi:hypothetical protein
VVTVRCRNCDTRYETNLPARSVRRIARCRACGLRALEVVDDRETTRRFDRGTDETPAPRSLP